MGRREKEIINIMGRSEKENIMGRREKENINIMGRSGKGKRMGKSAKGKIWEAVQKNMGRRKKRKKIWEELKKGKKYGMNYGKGE